MSKQLSNDNYCLQWENFKTLTLNSLRSEPENSLCDVSLISDDELNFSAHKVILSSCSSFFKNVFSKTIQHNPVIYLGGVSSINLSYLLDFIYTGKVQLRQDDIDSFLHQAQKLKVSGLSVQKVKETLKPKPPMIIPKAEKFDYGFTEPTSSRTNNSDPETIEELPEVQEPMEIEDASNNTSKNDTLVTAETEQEQKSEKCDNTPSKTKLDFFMEEKDGTFFCKFCDFRSKLRFSMKNHMENHIKGLVFKCDKCSKVFGTKKQLEVHTIKHEITANSSRPKSALNIEETVSEQIKCSNGFDVKINDFRVELSFKCELCQESFSKEELRKAHFEKVHWLDEKLRKCFSTTTNSDARPKNSVQEEEIGNKTDSIRVQAELVSDPKEKEHDSTGDNETVPAKIKVSGQAEAAKKFVELSTREDGVWKCRVCGYSTNNGKWALHSHMETHFDGLEYPCLHCSKVLATKNSLNAHKYQNHRDVMIIDDTSMDGAETRKSTGTSLGLGVDADAKMETKSEPVEAVEPIIEHFNKTVEEDNVTESETVKEPVVESAVSDTTDNTADNSSQDEDSGKNDKTNYDDFFLERDRAEADDPRRYNVAKIKVSSIEQAEQIGNELREKVEPGLFRCTHCGFKSRSNIRIHILSHFEGLEFNCDMCDKTCNTKHLLSCHKSKHHRE